MYVSESEDERSGIEHSKRHSQAIILLIDRERYSKKRRAIGNLNIVIERRKANIKKLRFSISVSWR